MTTTTSVPLDVPRSALRDLHRYGSLVDTLRDTCATLVSAGADDLETAAAVTEQYTALRERLLRAVPDADVEHVRTWTPQLTPTSTIATTFAAAAALSTNITTILGGHAWVVGMLVRDQKLTEALTQLDADSPTGASPLEPAEHSSGQYL